MAGFGFGNVGFVGSLTAGGITPPTSTQYAAPFITAAGITDATQQQALYALENALIAGGALDATTPANSLLKAFWPMVGGTAPAHSRNFVNPTTFPLGFNGGPVHNAGGITFSGSGQWAATGISPGTTLGDTATIGMYTTAITGGQYHMGSYAGSGKYLTIYQQGGNFVAGAYSNEVKADLSAQGNGLGFRASTRQTATEVRILLNAGSPQVFANSISLPVPVNELFIGGLNNNGAPGNFAGITVAGTFAAPGLPTAVVQAIRAAMQQFNASLARQV